MSATRCMAPAMFSHLFKAQGHLVAESRLRIADREVPRCVLVHIIVPRIRKARRRKSRKWKRAGRREKKRGTHVEA